MAVNSKDQIKIRNPGSPSNGTHGWLATRLPPYRNCTAGDEELTHLDVTHFYTAATGESPVSKILYDCRFLVTIEWAKVPHETRNLLTAGHKLMIVPESRYYLPRIIIRSPDSEDGVRDVTLGTTMCSNSNVPNLGAFEGADWASWEFLRKMSPDRDF